MTSTRAERRVSALPYGAARRAAAHAARGGNVGGVACARVGGAARNATARPYSLMNWVGLECCFCGRESRKGGVLSRLLLLFLHGLGGDAGSWGKFEQLLKTDADLKGRVDVAFYTFPTRLWRLIPSWRSLPAQDLAKGLATKIQVQYGEYQKILLVCHSFGGLIAKKYIVDIIKLSGQLRIMGVIFFATPHLGTENANIFGRFSFGHRQLNQLRIGADFIDGSSLKGVGKSEFGGGLAIAHKGSRLA